MINIFKNIKEFVLKLKDMSVSAIIRLFNKRTLHYDKVINDVDRFIESVSTDDSKFDFVKTDDITSGPSTRSSPSTRSGPSIRGGTALPIKKFVSPDSKKLAKDNKLMVSLHAIEDEIGHFLSALEGDRSVGGRKMRKEALTYLKTVGTKVDNLYKTLSNIAIKHEPELLQKLRIKAQRHLNKSIPVETYGGGIDSPYLYVTTKEVVSAGKVQKPIVFTYFIPLDDLDKDLYKNGDLWIVLTGVVTGISNGAERPASYHMETFITSLNSFKQPGSFNIGTRLEGVDYKKLETSLVKQLNLLISLNSLKPSLGKIKTKLTQGDLLNSPIMDIKYVEDVDVIDNVIHIYIGDKVPTTSVYNFILKKVIPHLKRLDRTTKAGGYVATDIEEEGGKYLIKFTKVRNMADY